jgi:hypothetical protein
MTNHIHLALQAGKNTFVTRFAQFLLPLYSLDQLAKKQHRPSFSGTLQGVLVDSDS